MRKCALVVAGVVLAAFAPNALSAMTANTIEAEAELSNKGRLAELDVILACDRAQRARVRVTLSQRGGAFAKGRRRVRCTTEDSTFPVKTRLRSRTRLAPGPATACVLVRSRDDAHQRCKTITLE